MDLGRRHVKLMKKIDQKAVIRTDPETAKDVRYLYDLGLIEAVSCPKPDDYYLEASRLTELGKAVLDCRILYYRDRLVPYVSTILSLIAIAISVWSIILQYAQTPV